MNVSPPTAESGEHARFDAPRRSASDLRDLTRRVVRAALHDELRGRRGSNDDMRHVLQQACDIARARGTHVEHMLILLKEAWRELPEARPRQYTDAQDALSRVITLCIEEYYAPLHPS